jgi:hypothetical protein
VITETKTTFVILIVGSTVGCVAGLIPFFVSDAMGRRKYGIIALGVCTFTGSIAGIIGALPICLIFMIGVFLHKQGDKK